jgi:carboxypeptidase PM20D1
MPILLILLGLVILLGAFMLYRTLTFPIPAEPVPAADLPEVDTATIAWNLSAIIQCRTISHSKDAPTEDAAFQELHDKLALQYPRVHSTLDKHTLNQWSLVYRWEGRDPALPPVIFMAHQDVVPAEEESEWTYPPFSGEVAEGFIWGRGTLDVKCQLTGLLDAAEHLLGMDFQPQRTIYLAFGHDEEIEGEQGAQAIVRWLEEQGIRPAAVLDEGGAVIEGILGGVDDPIAVIGTAEKGQVTLELAVDAAPGHASTPPKQTAVGILSKAIAQIEAHPMPAHPAAITSLIRHVGEKAPAGNRFMMANAWLLGGLIARVMSLNPQTNAMIRTTTAATIIKGGVKDNVLPRSARAHINCRLLPGDSIEDVAAHFRRVINDERVAVIVPPDGNAASPVSPTESSAFTSLRRTIKQTFGDIPVTPYLMLGASDSRHYVRLCDHVYRFEPVLMAQADLDRIHGIDERISVDAMARMVQFYMQIMQHWGDGDTL